MHYEHRTEKDYRQNEHRQNEQKQNEQEPKQNSRQVR
jgi:hypothetical protein